MFGFTPWHDGPAQYAHCHVGPCGEGEEEEAGASSAEAVGAEKDTEEDVNAEERRRRPVVAVASLGRGRSSLARFAGSFVAESGVVLMGQHCSGSA